jgi:hypothetical protein
MAVEKTKHEFVDDNPYLVYSGEPDTSVDNAGGGGGGGGTNDIMRVYINEAANRWDLDTSGLYNTALTANHTVNEIVQAINDNKEVVVYVKPNETVNRYFCLPLQAVNETPIDAFFAINIFFEASPFKALAVEIDSDSISGAFFS